MMSEASEGGGSRRSAGDGDQRTAGAHRNDTIDLTVVCVSAAHLGLRGSECVGGVVRWYEWDQKARIVSGSSVAFDFLGLAESECSRELISRRRGMTFPLFPTSSSSFARQCQVDLAVDHGDG